MDELVTRAGHLPPLDQRVSGAKVIGDLLHRLANDLQTPDKGPLQRLVGKKSRAGSPCGSIRKIPVSARICSQKLMDGFIVGVFFDERADKRA